MAIKKRLYKENGFKFQYYETEYPHEFPIGLYFQEKYKSIFSFADSSDKYDMSLKEGLTTLGYTLIWDYKRCTDSNVNTLTEFYEKDSILVCVKGKAETKRNNKMENIDYEFDVPTKNKIDYLSITQIYYVYDEHLNELFQLANRYKLPDKSISKISLLCSTRTGLDTVKQDIKETHIDIELNYGKKFKPIHEKIVSKLNTNNEKGLVLLHGLPGTGKTNYIRYLATLLDKEIIFLPPFLADSIASPDFITFLLDHTNSILIIEDAEKIVLDRDSDTSSRQSVANLLNMTDGLLSDCLSIQIIATFNTNRDKIDKALLRKGRLIAEWKFDALDIEHTKKIFKSIGREDIEVKKPMTLTEIYNYDEEVNVVDDNRKHIGFGR